MRALIEYFRPPAIRDTASLRAFMSGEASYLAQRSTYEFARNTLAWYGQAAFADPEFNDAFRICRWETFAAVLSGFVILTRHRLRQTAPVAPGVEAALLDQTSRMLAAYPTPTHRQDWFDVLTDIETRFADCEPTPGPADLGIAAAKRVYPTLPVRSANKAEDRKVIANALSFGTIAFNDRLAIRLDAAAIVPALLADRPVAATVP